MPRSPALPKGNGSFWCRIPTDICCDLPNTSGKNLRVDDCRRERFGVRLIRGR
jgi:hypothetical protein